MELGDMDRRLPEGELGDKLWALAASQAGADLPAGIDGASLEAALRSDDQAALRGVMERVLGTPEGRALAEKVRRAVNGHGR